MHERVHQNALSDFIFTHFNLRIATSLPAVMRTSSLSWPGFKAFLIVMMEFLNSIDSIQPSRINGVVVRKVRRPLVAYFSGFASMQGVDHFAAHLGFRELFDLPASDAAQQ